ncbi:ABC transporter ATP-binding protein [Inquilinus sp. CAU 1745]|uniref:ABC transporter ATP-binding protein n=1 Tax=Inquilinus sp. CAU 1745 TaxID=3140369 RepID=UPI00325BEC75
MAASKSVTEVQPKLLIEGLSKKFGKLTALEASDLSVAGSEFLTLLGPSGSGKSTLLQLICGLLEPSSGHVYIDGKEQSDIPVHRRDIGLVFQNYALFPHLTVAENVAFPLKMRGRASAEIKSRVKETLDLVQLGHLSGRLPKELSGGQQQRVALARCFVYQPSIILMDEPLGALDKKLRDNMQIEIKRLHRESRATIIYVTHDQEEALALSDRICLMNHARIEQIDTPHNIYMRPRTAFAADFIGISNILRGEVTRNGTAHRLKTPYGEFVLPEGCQDGAGALVIRPENLTLGEGAANRVSGTVKEVVYAGSETRVIASLSDDTDFIIRVPPGLNIPSLGETVTASWDPNTVAVVP